MATSFLLRTHCKRARTFHKGWESYQQYLRNVLFMAYLLRCIRSVSPKDRSRSPTRTIFSHIFERLRTDLASQISSSRGTDTHTAQRAQHVSLGFRFLCSVVHFCVAEWWWWCQGKKSPMLKKGREWNCKFSRQEFVFTEGWICGLLMRATGGAIIFLLMAKQASQASLESLPWRYVHTHARTHSYAELC
jgi:hypothetical protein